MDDAFAAGMQTATLAMTRRMRIASPSRDADGRPWPKSKTMLSQL